MKTPDVLELAVAFSAELDSTLTDEQMNGDDGVTARNAAEPDGSNICHSHDFCDANQLMLDACEKLGFSYSPNDNEEHDKLVSDAWDIAKRCEFHDETIRNYFTR